VRAALHTPKIVYLTPLDLHFGAHNSKFWPKILELGPSDNPTIGGGKGNLAGGKLILSPCQMRQMPIKQFDGSFLDHCSPISPPQALYVFSLWVKTMTQSQTKAAK